MDACCKLFTWTVIPGSLPADICKHERDSTFHAEHPTIVSGSGPAGSQRWESRLYGLVLMEFAGQPTSRFLEDLIRQAPDVTPTIEAPSIQRPVKMVVDVTADLALHLIDGLIDGEDPEFGIMTFTLAMSASRLETRSTTLKS